MLEILKENNPVAKKDHVCQFCGGVIKGGERYNRATISYNGDVYDWKSHLHCLELTVNLDMNRFCEDCGLTEEGFKDAIFDYICEHHSGDFKWGAMSTSERAKAIYDELHQPKVMNFQ